LLCSVGQKRVNKGRECIINFPRLMSLRHAYRRDSIMRTAMMCCLGHAGSDGPCHPEAINRSK
jgi:hypothetical protein